MKKMIFTALIAALLLLPGCAFHFPYDWDSEYSYGDYSVVLKVTPDDAHVLLNGKFIGEAYEFSTRASALKLRSGENELVVKREGYIEEPIDLRKYNMRKITITLDLRPDRMAGQERVVPGAAPPPQPPKATKAPVAPEAPEKEYSVVEEKVVPKEESIVLPTVDFSPVLMEVSPPEASIYVDGKFWGIAPEGGMINNFNLAKGKHNIEVVKPGYKSVLQLVEVTGKKEISVIIKLEKK